jgi:hypothetical protein
VSRSCSSAPAERGPGDPSLVPTVGDPRGDDRLDWRGALPLLVERLGALDDTALYDLRHDEMQARKARLVADDPNLPHEDRPTTPAGWLDRGLLGLSVALVLLDRQILEYEAETLDRHPGPAGWHVLDRVPGPHRVRRGRSETAEGRFARLLASYPPRAVPSPLEPSDGDRGGIPGLN